jgi:hypothetical protein
MADTTNCKGLDCPNYKRVKEDLNKLEKEFYEFKTFTYNKFDEIRNAYNSIREQQVRMEVLFVEKFAQIEKILAEKKDTNNNVWLSMLSNVLSPIVVGTILFFVLKK